jgi:hypothetical protein
MWRNTASFGKITTKVINPYADSIPAAGLPGYNPGAMVLLKNPQLGQALRYINYGTVDSCLFVPDGPSYGWGIMSAGAKYAVSGDTTTEIYGEWADTDVGMSGIIITDDVDYIISTAITASTGTLLVTHSEDPISAHSYLWAVLRKNIAPTWDIVYAGTAASTAATSTAITVTGVLATDRAYAWYTVTDDTDFVAAATCSANTVTVKHSTTSSTGHTIGYMVLRPRGVYAASHYIVYAGKGVATYADAAGIATNDVTLTGALATDLAYAIINSNAGTLKIVRATMAADTMTLQFSADPSTTSTFSYMVIRAY